MRRLLEHFASENVNSLAASIALKTGRNKTVTAWTIKVSNCFFVDFIKKRPVAFSGRVSTVATSIPSGVRVHDEALCAHIAPRLLAE
jgi:hypothetical protein